MKKIKLITTEYTYLESQGKDEALSEVYNLIFSKVVEIIKRKNNGLDNNTKVSYINNNSYLNGVKL